MNGGYVGRGMVNGVRIRKGQYIDEHFAVRLELRKRRRSLCPSREVYMYVLSQ